MKTILKSVLVFTAAAATGCGTSTPTATSAAAVASAVATPVAAGISCAKAGVLDAAPATAVPANLPLPAGATAYLSKGPFGKTSLFFAAVTGDPTNLDATRDAAVDVLVKAGYTLVRKDQEEGSEAEAHLTEPHETAIQVIQLGDQKVRIKYTLTS